MGLIGLVLVLVIIGVCLWLIESYIPMSPPIKVALRVVVVIVLVLWLLQTFVGDIPLPRFHR
jgi:O-antigen ligase